MVGAKEIGVEEVRAIVVGDSLVAARVHADIVWGQARGTGLNTKTKSPRTKTSESHFLQTGE